MTKATEGLTAVQDAPEARDRLSRQPFRILEWTVDAATGRLFRGDEEIRLEPKVMEVLVYLAGRPGEVVSRTDLEEQVWNQAVVSYETLTSTIQKLRRAFDDDARNPQVIETLSKRGYRLIAPVTLIESADTDLPAVGMVDEFVWGGDPRNLSARRLALLFAVLAVILGGWWLLDRTAPSPEATRTEPPSVAVLPFDNMSGDQQQEYFSDGMTEDLITDLSKIPGLLVISRSSSFSYKDKPKDIRDIARELGARYVIEGSVRKAGGMVRINAQLINAATGHHLWAERYDRDLKDVFALQDEIGEEIVRALALKLGPEVRKTLKKADTGNLEAYDIFLQGRNLFIQFSKDTTYRSRQYFEKAIELDPKYAHAYALLAWTYAFEHTNGWNVADQPLLTAEKLADRAIALDDKMPVAYFAKGLAFRERREYAKALAEARKSIDIDPNYANGHVLMATLLYYSGQPAEGLKMIDKASRLHPLHPSNYPFHRGQALFILKRYDEAIAAFKSGLKQNPSSQRLRVWLAATYAQTGRQEDAEWETEQVLVSDPNFSLKRLRQAFPFTDPVELDHIISALRKAGFKGDIR